MPDLWPWYNFRSQKCPSVAFWEFLVQLSSNLYSCNMHKKVMHKILIMTSMSLREITDACLHRAKTLLVSLWCCLRETVKALLDCTNCHLALHVHPAFFDLDSHLYHKTVDKCLYILQFFLRAALPFLCVLFMCCCFFWQLLIHKEIFSFAMILFLPGFPEVVSKSNIIC